MGARAVPYSTVASSPALQWVKTGVAVFDECCAVFADGAVLGCVFVSDFLRFINNGVFYLLYVARGVFGFV